MFKKLMGVDKEKYTFYEEIATSYVAIDVLSRIIALWNLDSDLVSFKRKL
jgi:hypothetical protein